MWARTTATRPPTAARTAGQSEFDSHRDLKGLSDFDQPHAFLARFAYETPAWSTQPPLVRAHSGPVEPLGGGSAQGRHARSWCSPVRIRRASETWTEPPGTGRISSTPSILGRTIGSPDTSQALLPKSAFSFISPGELAGNLGRNVFRKGGIYNVNAAIAKRFAVFHEKTLQLRAESINLFNTAQFAAPGSNLTNPEFGMITSTLNDGRTFRFLVSFDF